MVSEGGQIAPKVTKEKVTKRVTSESRWNAGNQ